MTPVIVAAVLSPVVSGAILVAVLSTVFVLVEVFSVQTIWMLSLIVLSCVGNVDLA